MAGLHVGGQQLSHVQYLIGGYSLKMANTIAIDDKTLKGKKKNQKIYIYLECDLGLVGRLHCDIDHTRDNYYSTKKKIIIIIRIISN